LVAAASGGNIQTTTIYKNGAVTTAVNGGVVGWLDNTRLLANEYAVNVSLPGSYHYAGAEIFSSSGSNLSSPPIPEIQSLQVVTADSIYSPSTNTIMSLTTGGTLWASADTACLLSSYNCVGAGAVTGSQVIFSAVSTEGSVWRRSARQPNTCEAAHTEVRQTPQGGSAPSTRRLRRSGRVCLIGIQKLICGLLVIHRQAAAHVTDVDRPSLKNMIFFSLCCAN
jgi:hypothetical protein